MRRIHHLLILVRHLFLVISLVILVIWSSSLVVNEFPDQPLAVIFALSMTVFALSRIIAALLYQFTKHVPEHNNYTPTVSIIIPCKNEEKRITKTVTQALSVDYPKDLLEVVVVNDGSTDKTGELLRSLDKKYSRLKRIDWKQNRGKRTAMYEAIKRSTGEIIVELDSDTYFERSTFRSIIEPFSNPKIGGVSAHTRTANRATNLLTKMQTTFYIVSFQISKAAESAFGRVFCLSGCASAYRRSAITPILDEWVTEQFLGKPVTWGDDRGLTNLILRQGFQTVYAEDAIAYTYCPESFDQFVRQQIRWKKDWFVSSLKALRFIIKTDPFVALTYFVPEFLITISTPFIAVTALLLPLILPGVSALAYVVGFFVLSLLLMLTARYVDGNPQVTYRYYLLWAPANILFSSVLFVYALLTIQNRGWLTR